MSIARHHAEWLSLLEVSGPFLTMPVLLRVFPQGLDANDPGLNRFLRMAYDEWADNQAGTRPDSAIHTQWLRFVLMNVLELPQELLLEGQAIPPSLSARVPDQHETLRPDMVLTSPEKQRPRLLIQSYPPRQDLEKPVPGRHWPASPATRMMELLHATDIRLGLVTNGEQWMLVDAPRNETTGFASWYAALWLEEQLTLRAFRSLLSSQRFFAVADNDTLEAMLAESANNQQEVTNRLGYQVRRAVEVLVQSLDRIDKDHNRVLLATLSQEDLYEAALTVMMRLVFLLSAEERGLLPLDEPLYNQNYAVSTLQAKLREQADQQGEEVLERRHDAWSRLLALFRVVYGGVEHQDLRLLAYGGRLFDPDRYPFLEGRAPATTWHETPALPLAINNRTVLHLLEALQFLRVRVQGGGPAETRRISFRALDIEQIGHVYEGLLDHTARLATTPVLGLAGSSPDKETEVTLAELQSLQAKGERDLLTFLEEKTERGTNALKKALLIIPDMFQRAALLVACDNDTALFEQVLPFFGLLRKDTFDNPFVITAGSVYVTQGTDRRTTGSHYTPRSLTEPIVQHTLDPLVYIGPAEGLPQDEWQLRPAADILALKVCDMAMGSGAFLVQACRYLSTKLIEAWEDAERILKAAQDKPRILQITPEGKPATGAPNEMIIPNEPEERAAIAKRLVVERCLYGVDKNPMAVEMAKLSLWLTTLDKNRPFTFLDHALRSGDSLLGVNLRQLTTWDIDNIQGNGTYRQMVWFEPTITRVLDTALALRRRISTMPEHDARDTQEKARLLAEAEEAMALVKLGADLLIATALIGFSDSKRREHLTGSIHVRYTILVSAFEDARRDQYTPKQWDTIRQAFNDMRHEVSALLQSRHPFHWPLEFPEVFAVGMDEERGFAAIVGNPPFQGGSKITGALGIDYRAYLVEYLAYDKRGNADLCAYFFLRGRQLMRQGGQSGLLATNTIAQGDTREVGLEQMEATGWTILRAVSSRPWPGTASLEVAHVWMKRGNWQGPYLLDEKFVEGITPFLTPSEVMQGKPYRLSCNINKSFQGSYVLGMGFILDPEEAKNLIRKDPCNQDVLFPYLNGEDLNSRYDQSSSRWIINFRDWSLEQIDIYPDCVKIVREKVEPERKLNSDRNLRERWWQYKRPCLSLYAAIDGMSHILVCPIFTKYLSFCFVPSNQVFMNKLQVFPFDQHRYLALLNSTIHEIWAREFSATLETRLQYTPTDCFETFPFPNDMQGLDNIGERYYYYRQSIMLTRQEGLTKTYNRFHDLQEIAEDIVRLRELHKEMDEAVAKAYGWDDLELGHGFHETKQGVRYTISNEARREVLGRLLQLNHERYAEEVAQGLHEKGAKKGKGVKTKASKDKLKQQKADEAEQGTLLFD